MRHVFGTVSFVFLACMASMPVVGDTLDEIGKKGSINLGFRTDAAPFSFLDDTNRAAGLSVDLCLRIVEDIEKRLAQPIAAKFVPVGVSDGFSALAENEIDILCAASTVTFKRREIVDFTLFTFITGGTLMTRVDAADLNVEANAKPKIGVLAGSTSRDALEELAASEKIRVEIYPVDTHDLAIGLLTSKVIDGYFGDRELLWDRLQRSSDPSAFVISDRLLTSERYALAVKRGENQLRLVSDRVLAETYRSGNIYDLIQRWFPNARPSPLLKALYFNQAISDD